MHRVPFDRVALVALSEHLGRQTRSAFSLMLTGAGPLLLLARADVADLVGARNVERQRDDDSPTWLTSDLLLVVAAARTLMPSLRAAFTDAVRAQRGSEPGRGGPHLEPTDAESDNL